MIKNIRVDEFVASHANMKSKPTALPRQITNLKHWHMNNDNAILEEERAYINQDEDLITIVPVTKTPLRRYLEETECFKSSRWFQRRPSKALTSLNNDGTVLYHSDALINAFDNGLVILIGLSMLVAPIWVLFAVDSIKGRLGVITTFVTTFLLLLQVLTAATPAEILAATAA